MRLVGVAGVERGAREVAVRGREEAAEAQHALERLRAVAGGGVAAPPQLALAEAEVVGERLDARARIAASRRAASATAASAGAAASAIAAIRRSRLARVEVAGQPLGQLGAQLLEADALVAQLRQRQPERGAARAGAEARADEHVPGRRGHRHGAGVRPGHERAAAGLPDQVRAGVRQHVGGRRRRRAHPQAGERRGGELAVHAPNGPTPMSVPFKTALMS